MTNKTGQREHSKECRMRIEEMMAEAGGVFAERLQRKREEIDEFIAKEVEKAAEVVVVRI